MKLNKRQMFLINSSFDEMTLEDWEEYMQDVELVKYRLSQYQHIQPKILKNKLKDLFPSFKSFLYIFEKYNKNYIKKIKSILKEFYDNNSELYIKKYYFEIDLRKVLSGKMNHKKLHPGDVKFLLRLGYSLSNSKTIIRDRNIKAMMKSPSHINFWIIKGYSKTESKQKVRETMAKKNPINFEKYLEQGLTLEEAQLKINEYQKKMNPLIKDYWISKGKTEDEAIQIIKEYSTKLNSSSSNPLHKKVNYVFLDCLRNYLQNKYKNNLINIQYQTFGCEKDIRNIDKTHELFNRISFIRLDCFIEFSNGLKLNIELDDKSHRRLSRREEDLIRDDYLENHLFIKVLRISKSLFKHKENFEKLFREVDEIYENYKHRIN